REIRHALDWIAADSSPVGSAKVTATTASEAAPRFWQVTAGLALLFAAAIAVWALTPARREIPQPVRFDIRPPDKAQLETYVAVSPDGQHVAFTATGEDGNVRIWVRDLKALEPRVLAGTEGAQSLFWSPDSRSLAFGLSGQVKRIDATGGPAQTLCTVQ